MEIRSSLLIVLMALLLPPVGTSAAEALDAATAEMETALGRLYPLHST